MAFLHKLIGRGLRVWWFVTRPRTFGARAVVVDRAGRIALVRHSYMKHWYLPGGGVNKGEGAAAAVLRELREEIGVGDAAIERVLGVYHSRREYKDDHVVVFVTRVPEGSEGAMHAADGFEIAAAQWFAADALPGDLSPATARRIGEYLAGTTGFGAW